MHCAKLRSISFCAWLVARGRVVINALSNDLFLLIASVIGAEQLDSSKVVRLSVGRNTVASGAQLGAISQRPLFLLVEYVGLFRQHYRYCALSRWPPCDSLCSVE